MSFHRKVLAALWVALLLVVGAVSLSSATAHGFGSAGDENKTPGVVFLEKEGIGSDQDSVMAYLRKLSSGPAEPRNIDSLIRDLESDDFRVRERATESLKQLHFVAVEPMVKAMRSGASPETTSRIRTLLAEIGRDHKWGLPLAAVRRLLELSPDVTVDVLLRYLPYAPDDARIEEI